jgi:hypothetical protein
MITLVSSAVCCAVGGAGLGSELTSRLRVVYLTARPLRHLAETKRFIAGVRQQSHAEQLLPAGPLFCNKVGGGLVCVLLCCCVVLCCAVLLTCPDLSCHVLSGGAAAGAVRGDAGHHGGLQGAAAAGLPGCAVLCCVVL